MTIKNRTLVATLLGLTLFTGTPAMAEMCDMPDCKHVAGSTCAECDMPCCKAACATIKPDRMCDMPCCKGEPAHAAHDHHQGQHMDHGKSTSGAMNTPLDIYAPAMDKMMAAMPQPVGDADADFMRGMIVHHQAAVEMSSTALQQAQDPQVRALAEAIITAQQSEIAHMREWLRMHDFPQP